LRPGAAVSFKNLNKSSPLHAGIECSTKASHQSILKLRGIDKVGWLFTFTGAAYNLMAEA
jgi:hypothetical protein